MFGELEDSDIYVSNQDESFEEPSEFDTGSGQEVVLQAPPKANDNKRIFVYVGILIILLVCAGATYLYKMKSSQDADVLVPGDENAQQMGDYFYDKAKGENPDVAQTAVVDVDLTVPSTPADAQKDAVKKSEPDAAKPADKEFSPVVAAREKEKKELEKKNKLAMNSVAHVVVPVTNGGRANPFIPYNNAPILTKVPDFDIIAPPLDIPVADPINDELMTTKVSGIMYDNQRPSAIINFGGSDHLVHRGDKVKGYCVVDITRDRVVMKYGSNIYRVAVGQELDESENSVKFNDVSNLNRQFGGAYAKTPRNMIEVNGN